MTIKVFEGDHLNYQRHKLFRFYLLLFLEAKKIVLIHLHSCQMMSEMFHHVWTLKHDGCLSCPHILCHHCQRRYKWGSLVLYYPHLSFQTIASTFPLDWKLKYDHSKHQSHTYSLHCQVLHYWGIWTVHCHCQNSQYYCWMSNLD